MSSERCIDFAYFISLLPQRGIIWDTITDHLDTLLRLEETYSERLSQPESEQAVTPVELPLQLTVDLADSLALMMPETTLTSAVDQE
ncbi:unnamed protein product [Ceratitis capitata]|uniref:(Mediterranean fruit fly) hypothetical protein n=1 Tax=Ceratitis capitata TaxID=7213 RepID=A0A811U6N6_CERCA|nr:unnamed protein product [Ceratitis capitata]